MSIDITIKRPTTSETELWDILNRAQSCKYVFSWGYNTWTWKTGERAYWIDLLFKVNSSLPQETLERFISTHFNLNKTTVKLHNNTGAPTVENVLKSYRKNATEINLKTRLQKKQSLLSTDITKPKQPSLKNIKLLDRAPIIQTERPPTAEEIAYSNLVAINPFIEEIVERLDLVSIKTGTRIKKVKINE